MIRSCGFGWRLDVIWLLAFGLASSAWCLTAAGQIGATFDEPFYLNAGLNSWRTGSNKPLMSAGAMPLTIDAQTLPLYLWECHRGSEFHAYQDIATILPVARAANLLFWWALLGYALLLGRTFGGPWAGRLAVGFLACDPNFLGHASLATSDIGIVAAMLALIYHYHHGQGKNWVPRVLVPGLLFGIATLAKASGMVFGVQAMLVLGLIHLHQQGTLAPRAGARLREQLVHIWHAGFAMRLDLLAIMCIGFALVFAYTGSDWGTEPTFVTWAEGLPDSTVKSVMLPLSERLTIFPNAGEALIQQIKHNMRGHGTFLLGRYYPRSTPEYFPVALSIKTPAPMLALLLMVLMIRPRNLLTPIGGIALVLFLFSLNCRVQIGIRFMFTLMATMDIALAVAVARTWVEGEQGRFVPRWFVGTLLAIMAGTAAWVWPHGLSYTNQLWGGVEHGYRHLSDSNYDWGQGLPALKRWNAEEHAGQPLAIWYFGTDPAILYAPFKPIHVFDMQTGTADELRSLSGTRYLAVSMSVLYGQETKLPGHLAALHLLRTAMPVGRTPQFFIYDLQSL